ncbi:N5-carboxyethyl-ornithine synthase [Candidatus Magnetomorum sp. HK-1]|nr:N5-carboxyethyl-ornithine synthase [Candidatus Magnetomorum sp. HK-1]
MKIAYILPNFSGEKRVGLLPQHLKYCHSDDERRFEKNFGATLGILDKTYGKSGGYTRESLFEWADVIYCIKIPQDQDNFREKQGFVGWIHPTGSGKHFMENCVQNKKLIAFDITNRISIRYNNNKGEILNVDRDITMKNSILAGYASVMHAVMLRGGIIKDEKVAIFGSGNVAYGALKYLANMGIDPILRRRSNIALFEKEFHNYDIFINAVEIDEDDKAIVNQEMISAMKPNAWIIDAAADAGRAIENTKYTSIDSPIYQDDQGHTFYIVNNSPSLLFRESSQFVSQGYAKHFWSKPMKYWYSDDCVKGVI